MTRGPIEAAIRSTIRSGARLTTPARRATFTVAAVDEKGLVLLLGDQEAHTRIPWAALEEAGELLTVDTWVPIGSSYSTDATPGTLDAYLKRHVNRATAGWVAAVLEAAGIVDIDRRRPARVRLLPGASDASR